MENDVELQKVYFITSMIDRCYKKMQSVKEQNIDVENRLSQLLEILNDMQKKILMITHTTPRGIVATSTVVYEKAIKKV